MAWKPREAKNFDVLVGYIVHGFVPDSLLGRSSHVESHVSPIPSSTSDLMEKAARIGDTSRRNESEHVEPSIDKSNNPEVKPRKSNRCRFFATKKGTWGSCVPLAVNTF